MLSLKVFRQIIESGTFTAAAEKMEMSVAMVSKHVRHLEQRVGCALLHRSSRRVSLSVAGRFYFERCAEILNTLDETESELLNAQRNLQGTLRLTAPSWFGNRRFAKVLAGYRRVHPRVRLDLMLDDGSLNLVEQGVDLALRVSLGLDVNLPARVICPVEFGIVGSHQYFARHGQPRSLAELLDHQLVGYAYEAPNALEFRLPEPTSRCNNTNLMAFLVGEGEGLAVLPCWAITDFANWQETYKFVLPDAPLPKPYLYAVTHQQRRLSAKITAFMDFLSQELTV